MTGTRINDANVVSFYILTAYKTGNTGQPETHQTITIELIAPTTADGLIAADAAIRRELSREDSAIRSTSNTAIGNPPVFFPQSPPSGGIGTVPIGTIIQTSKPMLPAETIFAPLGS